MSYKLNLLDEKLFNKFSNALKSFKDKHKKFSWGSSQKKLYTNRQESAKSNGESTKGIDLNIVQLNTNLHF